MEVLSSFVSGCSRISYPPTEKMLLTSINLTDWNQGNVAFLPFKRSHCTLSHQTPFLKKKADTFQVFCSEKREISVVEAGCMEDIYDILAERLVPTATAAPNSNFKHIVGLAGPPGAGKSTLASEVVQRVNKLWPQKCASVSIDSQVEPSEVAIVLPMDGFHLYRHQLDSMEDPEEAHARRGAPWTFTPELLLKCLRTLKNQGYVYAPSFDHGVGDPVEDDILVDIRHKVVIVEGNYLFLEEGAWKEISSEFDEKWFIDVDIEKAMERVLRRHISTGKPPDVAKWRIDYNDQPNAELILRTKKNSDLVIKLYLGGAVKGNENLASIVGEKAKHFLTKTSRYWSMLITRQQ